MSQTEEELRVEWWHRGLRFTDGTDPTCDHAVRVALYNYAMSAAAADGWAAPPTPYLQIVDGQLWWFAQIVKHEDMRRAEITDLYDKAGREAFGL